MGLLFRLGFVCISSVSGTPFLSRKYPPCGTAAWEMPEERRSAADNKINIFFIVKTNNKKTVFVFLWSCFYLESGFAGLREDR